MSRQSAILVDIYTETGERVMSDWVAGGWVVLRRVFENNKRIKMGVGLGVRLCT